MSSCVQSDRGNPFDFPSRYRFNDERLATRPDRIATPTASHSRRGRRRRSREGRSRSRGTSRVSRVTTEATPVLRDGETGRRAAPGRTREACAHEPPGVLSPSRNVILPLAPSLLRPRFLAQVSPPCPPPFGHSQRPRPLPSRFIRIANSRPVGRSASAAIRDRTERGERLRERKFATTIIGQDERADLLIPRDARDVYRDVILLTLSEVSDNKSAMDVHVLTLYRNNISNVFCPKSFGIPARIFSSYLRAKVKSTNEGGK